jgi:DNA-binding transcriptional ArsR family regulator
MTNLDFAEAVKLEILKQARPGLLFTKLPNEFLDLWMFRLKRSDILVFLYLCRRILGFNKRSDRVSIAQICTGIVRNDGRVLDRGTQLDKSSVRRSLRRLEALGLIERSPWLNHEGGSEANQFRILCGFQRQD